MTMPDENETHGESGTHAATHAAFSPETFCEEVENYITEKPFQSLAIALLAGIIVGKIIL
ncbi:MAG TPA: hypothetical protein VKR31_15295 [Rhizomicrobium sp.]|nr:hypothetical protein [Rhizomicrobium sp.]